MAKKFKNCPVRTVRTVRSHFGSRSSDLTAYQAFTQSHKDMRFRDASVWVAVVWIVTVATMLLASAFLESTGKLVLISLVLFICGLPSQIVAGALCAGVTTEDKIGDFGQVWTRGKKFNSFFYLLALLLWLTGGSLYLFGDGGLWFKGQTSPDFIVHGCAVSSLPRQSFYIYCDDGWFPPATVTPHARLTKEFDAVSKGVNAGSVGISVAPIYKNKVSYEANANSIVALAVNIRSAPSISTEGCTENPCVSPPVEEVLCSEGHGICGMGQAHFENLGRSLDHVSHVPGMVAEAVRAQPVWGGDAVAALPFIYIMEPGDILSSRLPFFILGFLGLILGSPCVCPLIGRTLGGTGSTGASAGSEDAPVHITMIGVSQQGEVRIVGASGFAFPPQPTKAENEALANELRANS